MESEMLEPEKKGVKEIKNRSNNTGMRECV